jgi:hypothetical protein
LVRDKKVVGVFVRFRAPLAEFTTFTMVAMYWVVGTPVADAEEDCQAASFGCKPG